MKSNFQTPLLILGLVVFSPLTALADGKSTYSEHCGSCHNGGFKGLMARAPKIGKDKAWKNYFASGADGAKSKVLNGSEKHKAMGEEANLSAEEINAAVDYILSKTNVAGQ